MINTRLCQLAAMALFAWHAGTVLAAPAAALSKDSFAQIRARHAGQPLVVHIWGMTCGPCMVELPQWGALLRRQPHMKLVLIQADQAPAQAREQMLDQAGLGRAESWAATGELDEYLRASIDRQWQGDMPRTLLITAQGEVTRIQGVANLAHVSQWLRQQSHPRP